MKNWQINLLLNIKGKRSIRIFLFPLMNIYKYIADYIYAHSLEPKKLKEMKNIHKGKRCFIIGNGPSLLVSDLEKIKREITFAANGIFHLFDITSWRPNYYLCVDLVMFQKYSEFLCKLNIDNKLFINTGNKYIRKCNQINGNIVMINQDRTFTKQKSDFMQPYVSEDVSTIVSRGNTVTFTAIQFAFYMGFNEIYLIGVDHNYSKKIDEHGTVTEDPSIKTYCAGIPDSGFGIQYIDMTNAAYTVAQKYAEAHGISIYNATRGGQLDAFPRINFDEISFKDV